VPDERTNRVWPLSFCGLCPSQFAASSRLQWETPIHLQPGIILPLQTLASLTITRFDFPQHRRVEETYQCIRGRSCPAAGGYSQGVLLDYHGRWRGLRPNGLDVRLWRHGCDAEEVPLFEQFIPPIWHGPSPVPSSHPSTAWKRYLGAA